LVLFACDSGHLSHSKHSLTRKIYMPAGKASVKKKKPVIKRGTKSSSGTKVSSVKTVTENTINRKIDKKPSKDSVPAGRKVSPPKGRGAVSGGKTPKKIIETLSPPRGMHDILPVDAPVRNKIINTAKHIAEYYGFSEIETPILERVELFTKSIGETTDIVEKEMYTLRTKGGDRLALRPEGTAPVVRAYLQNGMHKLPQPQKLYYIGPFFRHERPQAGRFRQFHQVGLEIVGGDSDPVYDAEIIVMFYSTLEELKTGPLAVHINSIGCRICRPGYRTKLVNYYKNQEVCKDCKRRIKDHPLRLLDCKKEQCQPVKAQAPSILDSLCSLCRNNLKQVLEHLEEFDLPYVLNPLLVRGLDYYNRTVFEIFAEDNDLALTSGGRYDYLAEMIGGRSTPAGGAAMGIERVIEVMRESNPKAFDQKTRHEVFLVHIGELAVKKSLPLIEELRKNNIPVATSFGKKSLSHQLEAADKGNAQIALILGQKEVYDKSVIIRNMETGVQESVPVEKVVGEIKKRLR